MDGVKLKSYPQKWCSTAPKFPLDSIVLSNRSAPLPSLRCIVSLYGKQVTRSQHIVRTKTTNIAFTQKSQSGSLASRVGPLSLKATRAGPLRQLVLINSAHTVTTGARWCDTRVRVAADCPISDMSKVLKLSRHVNNQSVSLSKHRVSAQ